MKLETIYEQAAQKYIYKMLHSEDGHYITDYWIKNRNINRSQNKVGHHDQMVGRTNISQGTILYAAVNLYNKLPKNLTLIKSKNMFKKWLKRYHLDNKTKLREQLDNLIEDELQTTNQQIMYKCYTDFNNF